MNITPCFWATVEASQIDFISLWGGHVHLSQRTGNGAVFSYAGCTLWLPHSSDI